MYESLTRGLGWNEPEGWYDIANAAGACNLRGPSGSPREICFNNTPQDAEIAYQSRCTRISSFFSDSPVGCNDGQGAVWCCPEGYPREYMRDVPSDVSIYEEARRRHLEEEPASPPGQLPPDRRPDGGTPRPVSQHTFLTRLSHPGAIAAIALLGGGGALFFFMRRRRGRRYR